MINNFWEEQNMDKNIYKIHNEKMEKIGLPQWIKNLKCPFCKENLPLRSVRTIGLKFNTRNIGDIVVEVFCDNCSKMDTLYFREHSNISKFIDCLNGSIPSSDPIVEEDMYKMNYNNLLGIESTRKE